MAIQWDKPSITEELYQIVRMLIRRIGVLESEEHHDNQFAHGSILIFLPGIYEIGRLYTILSDYST